MVHLTIDLTYWSGLTAEGHERAMSPSACSQQEPGKMPCYVVSGLYSLETKRTKRNETKRNASLYTAYH